MGGKHDDGAERTQILKRPGADAPREEFDTDDLGTELVRAKRDRVVARLHVVEGPGIGEIRDLFPGTNSLGRAKINGVQLNFGDSTISRDTHALITVDPKTSVIEIYDGGKKNPVYVNGALLSGRRRLAIGDTIMLGNTTLRLSGT